MFNIWQKEFSFERSFWTFLWPIVSFRFGHQSFFGRKFVRCSTLTNNETNRSSRTIAENDESHCDFVFRRTFEEIFEPVFAANSQSTDRSTMLAEPIEIKQNFSDKSFRSHRFESFCIDSRVRECNEVQIWMFDSFRMYWRSTSIVVRWPSEEKDRANYVRVRLTENERPDVKIFRFRCLSKEKLPDRHSTTRKMPEHFLSSRQRWTKFELHFRDDRSAPTKTGIKSISFSRVSRSLNKNELSSNSDGKVTTGEDNNSEGIRSILWAIKPFVCGWLMFEDLVRVEQLENERKDCLLFLVFFPPLYLLCSFPIRDIVVNDSFDIDFDAFCRRDIFRGLDFYKCIVGHGGLIV